MVIVSVGNTNANANADAMASISLIVGAKFKLKETLSFRYTQMSAGRTERVLTVSKDSIFTVRSVTPDRNTTYGQGYVAGFNIDPPIDAGEDVYNSMVYVVSYLPPSLGGEPGKPHVTAQLDGPQDRCKSTGKLKTVTPVEFFEKVGSL